MTVVFLAACGDKKVENPDVEDTGTEQVTDVAVDSVDWDLDNEENDGTEYAKTSLTVEDLDHIDEVLFPVSYNYEVYKWEDENTSDSWSHTYPSDVDHSLLLPIHADVVSREVVSSNIEDGMIYTTVDATLEDGSVISILYINDPITLQYVAASVNTDVETTLYSFVY